MSVEPVMTLWAAENPPIETLPVGTAILTLLGTMLGLGALAAFLRWAPLTLKWFLGLFGVSILVALVVLTDYPRADREWFNWWSENPLFTGALTSVVLLGAGFVALDISRERAEEQKREERDRRAEERIQFEEKRKQHIAALLGDLRSILELESAQLAAMGVFPGGEFLQTHQAGAATRRETRDLIREHMQTIRLWFSTLALSESTEAHDRSRSLLKHHGHASQVVSAYDSAQDFNLLVDVRRRQGERTDAAIDNARYRRKALADVVLDFHKSLRTLIEELPDPSPASEPSKAEGANRGIHA